jgi:hypothetical protein
MLWLNYEVVIVWFLFITNFKLKIFYGVKGLSPSRYAFIGGGYCL